MKTKLHFRFLSLAFFILSIAGNAQCPSGNIHFTSQAQIDDFLINYPNCTQFPGMITVEGSNITNLNGLSNLTKIGSHLRIWHTTQLFNLQGLESLTEIGGNLNLFTNHNIQSLEGLNNLTKIGVHFDFYINLSLKEVNALSNLTQIGGFLQLSESPQITDISGLRNINPSTISGSGLHLVNNSSLSVCNLPNFCTYLQGSGPRNINGNAGNCISVQAISNACNVSCTAGNITLNSQAQVDQFGGTYMHCSNVGINDLTISGSDIVNLNGLAKINGIDQLKIQNNSQLMNLSGLNQLTNISENLHISGNLVLNDISVLETLSLENLNELVISNNPSLSVCNLSNICEYLSDESHSRTINGNAGDCFDEAAVLLACFPCEAPQNLGIGNLSTHSADLVWESDSELFDIQWGTSGFNLGSGTMLTGIEGNLHPLTGLSQNTQYEFYVRTDCDLTKSEWIGPFAFTTLYPCPSGDFTFTSQQQVDNFGAMYGNCTNITLGNVQITNTNITDLSPLSNVTYVTARLFISDNPQLIYLEGLNNLTQVGRLVIQSNNSLTNLEGLANLTQIEGELLISLNTSLSSLNGLNNLTEVGELLIQFNNSLTNLEGLENLTQIEGQLFISSNTSLTNLEGLANLTQIEGELFINSNTSLSSLNGLNNLTEVGRLVIQSNNSLTNLEGLENLTQIEGQLSISSNTSLTNLEGLANLTQIEGQLFINSNTSLTNLDGLENLTQIAELYINNNLQLNDISGLQNIDPSTIGGYFGLRVRNNPNLSVCNLPNFCTYLQGPGPRSIYGNAGDCITAQAVMDACQACEAPANLGVENLSTNSADLVWESDGELFDIQWGLEGFEPGNGTFLSGIEETIYHLSGLTAHTQYEFYVRTDCGESNQSEWAGPYAFMSLIEPNPLFAFGKGSDGQLGTEDHTQQTTPVQSGTKIWKQISAGDLHSIGIQEDGTLWSWGDGNMGRLGTGNLNKEFTPVQVGTELWKSISAGYGHNLGIGDDGTLWAWGEGSSGRLGTGNTNQQNFPVQINNESWQLVSAGSSHSLAIKSDGTLWAWGSGGSGELGTGDFNDQWTPIQIGSETWKYISAGETHSLGIQSDGTLWAWGAGISGQLGTGSTNNQNIPVQIGNDKWLYVSGGRTHSLGIKSDGTLWAWGSGNDGRVGTGDTAPQLSPVMINSETWVYVAAGHFHSLAIKSDGSLWTWGSGAFGKLGTDTTENQLVPVQIGENTYSLVAGGGYHSLALGKLPCAVPENLGVENLHTNSADLTWESDGELFDIQWGTAGFELGSGALLTGIEGNSHQLTGLSPNTQYEFYVRTDCGLTKSEWAGPFGFSTLITCSTGNIILSTQQQVDDFGDMYAHCTIISGNLWIGLSSASEYNTSNIIDITPLQNLTEITGNLVLGVNRNLTSLEGLNSLESIGGNLRFWNNNRSLTNLEGLNNLQSIGGSLEIVENWNNNSALTNIEGLSNLTQIGGGVYIYNNNSLTNLVGLNNLSQIGGYLYITSNNSLTNLVGLNNLSQIGGDVYIYNNNSLTNLDGLNSLSQIGGGVYIYENNSLTNLDGLANLTQIGGDLVIAYNPHLNDISGLQNTDPSTIGGYYGLRVSNNPNLSVCNLPNFCTYLQGPGPRTISGNAGDCITEQAVLDACEQSGNCGDETLWNGLAWSNGLPDFTKKAIIDGPLVMASDLEACELEVTADGSLEIPAGFSFTVNGMVSNLGAAENFVVANDGNLIQIEEVENLGEITVIRESRPMIRLDYTLWSSPVSGQNLFGFSPQTVNGVTNYPGSAGRIYVYDGANGYVNPDPFTPEAVMENGVGYLFRSPNNWSATEAVSYIGTFTGVPKNGNIQVATHAGNYTSIGNPYPSNITLNDLYAANPDINTVYFWNNNHSAGNNYATCTNGLGCVAAMGGGNTPNGILTTGQGFIVHTDDSSVIFNNTMRADNSGIFFKVDELESHRFWLNLDGQTERYNQILIGYVSGATNQVDAQIDAELFNYTGSALYNLIEDEQYVIQGRALPFEAEDVVPLGFRASEGGKFKISLADFDGIFAEGNTTIYLKDNQLNIAHNLMESDYEFESTQGEFKERFEVIYETDGTMGTGDYDSNLVQIYQNENQIIVTSKTEKILSVELFDLSGRNLHRNTKVNANHYEIESKVFGTQVLIVKVQIEKGEVVTKKLINK